MQQKPVYMQDVAYGTMDINMDSGDSLTATKYESLSETSMYRKASSCASTQRQSLTGLDHFTACGMDSSDKLMKMVEQCKELGADVKVCDTDKQKITNGQNCSQNLKVI